MSRAHKIGNVLGVFIPIVAFLAAVVLLWEEAVGPFELSLMLGLYVLTGLGITVGFHRMLTHRSFEAGRPVRAALAILGSMAVQGPVITWVADHRKHHAFTDEPGDPHSPHLSRLPGVLGAIGGLWHAHVGWVALGLAIPFAIGFALGGLRGALLALLWGGLVRIFLLHHVTFAINSLCHFLGRRRFSTADESRNVAWLAPLSFGEAWHHNHHAFPTSAFHGLRRWEIDPGGWLIRGLERLGLAWNVVRVGEDRQRERLAVGSRP